MNLQASIPAGHRVNSAGHLVPEDLISPVDKLRDDVVRDIIAKAIEQRNALASFKLQSMQKIADFCDLSAAEYGVEWGGVKGNVTMMSFDGRYKLIRAVGEHRVFDERIQAAKTLIDECIAKWSEGAQSELKALVEHAFRVSKQGHIDVNQVLSLRQISIDDPDWKSAMDAIADAIQITGTSQYLRLYERQQDGRYVQIPLDSAKV
ncbi:conserved hypothetical protein [Tolumonas auensis DSM 9187]|uniref:Sulfate transport protein CysZ n=1 Tax=Tolumonas auensis (strain DSM 9187 / NBRC 110442 / TA 4) TaxID=595494 RepID=C4LBB3_TOLAT|nr:DUF3164 family protein [Tolumonas auensis]ACQ92348.1 conserved hypothetical protein [Tolumonas auensis DSM 9187]